LADLTWDSTDLDAGTDDGIVHESTPNTAYDDASAIRKGVPSDAADVLHSADVEMLLLMQESSGGTAYDFSGNNNDGAVNGASPAGGVPVADLPTYSFDGADDYIDLPNYLPAGPHTLHAVFATTSMSGSNEYICDMRGDVDSIIGWDTAGNDGELAYWDGSWNFTGEVVNDGNIHIVSVANDGNDFDVVLDSEKVYSNSADNISDSYNKSPKIGVDPFLGSFIDASIGLFRADSAALSVSQMQDWHDIFLAPSKHTSTKKQL
jgi:hypothetical protein